MTIWCGFLVCLVVVPVPADRVKADANRLVADALVAEATWHSFPGFVADLKIEFNGRARHGRVVVDGGGRVFVEHVPAAHRAWAIQRLGCVVRQRFPKNDAENKTWMFANLKDERTPLGQAVCRTDAPFGPYFWIQKQLVHAVESRTARYKQLLTTLKTERNADNKHLPVVQILHLWNARTLELETTETTLLSWQRVGRFDLPASIQVLSAGTAGQPATPTIGRMVLTRHQLFASPEPLINEGKR